MDDDNADWLSAADEPEPAPTPATGPAAAAKTEAAAESAGAEAAAGEAAAESAAEAAEAADEYLDPDKLLLFKHWIRPKYLQYKYLYDYRRSYYDDVVEAIENRKKGFRRNIPRPQMWAERVMRTYSHPIYRLETFDRFLEDIKLVTKSEISGRIYSSQVASNFNKRFTTRIDF